jgi:phosphatidylglycerophosphate synthase
MNKNLAIALSLFHVLLSGLSTYNTWPLKVFAGLEIESTVVAIVAAAIGTILGLPKIVNKKLIPILIVCGIIFVLAVVAYSFILSQPGATPAQLGFALFLFFILFLIFFYVITYLERTLVRTFPKKKVSD